MGEFFFVIIETEVSLVWYGVGSGVLREVDFFFEFCFLGWD